MDNLQVRHRRSDHAQQHSISTLSLTLTLNFKIMLTTTAVISFSVFREGVPRGKLGVPGQLMIRLCLKK